MTDIGGPQHLSAMSDATVVDLLERNMPALQAFIRLRMGNALSARESSSDVLQSVCRELIAARGHVHFDGEAAFRSWLYTAALRKIRMVMQGGKLIVKPE